MKNKECKKQDNKKNTTSVNIIKIREDMTDEEFNDFMKLSLEQAESGESISVDEAFGELFKELLND